MTTQHFVLERAILPDGVADNVAITVENGRFTAVGGPADSTAERIPGLSLPGLANAHSHAFHRALRGRTQRGQGTFWTWREQMYDLAGRLDPDSYFTLARAAYKEMVAAGFTTVGEFHYLHHTPTGAPYDDPNAMSHALVEAAREAGIRIALLDTCYLSAGFGAPPAGVQIRYSDWSADYWAHRVNEFAAYESDDVVVGAAIHSVRAVPADELTTVAFGRADRPLHVHLSEQVAENEACLAETGLTPTALLAEHDALGPLTSAVHATHLTDFDIALLGATQTVSCFCPTTERDLGDGIGPSRALVLAGSPLSLGTDSHAVVDAFEEMRAIELDERLSAQTRGNWTAWELLEIGTNHASLGFAGVGRIEVGARADLVTLDPNSPRTAGTGADENTVVYAAGSADVRRVMVDGKVHYDGDAAALGAELAETIGDLW